MSLLRERKLIFLLELFEREKMAQNLKYFIDEDDDDEIILYEKLTSNKQKFNSNTDSKEKIKKQRREKQKMRDDAYKEVGELDV